MPINQVLSKQNWTPGNWVKIGFLKLKILTYLPTPGDHQPDKYFLTNGKGSLYAFTPHHGLKRLTQVDLF